MSDMMPSLMDATTTFLKSVCGNLGLALSEALSVDMGLELERIEAIPIQELLVRTEEAVWTTFSLSAPQTSDCVVLFSEEAALALAVILAGNVIGSATETLSETDVAQLTQAAAALVRGLATSVANITGDSVDVETCVTTQGSLVLPPVFAMEQSALEAHFTLNLLEAQPIPMQFLFTPEFAQALITLAEEGAQSDANQVLGDDELAAMLSELEGLSGDADMPTSTMESGVAPPPFANFPTAPTDANLTRGMELIMDIPLDVTVELGRVRMLIRDVLDLASGSIIELDRVAGEPVDLLVNGRLVAKGEVVVIEDNFGIRLTEIVSPVDRVVGLGKGR